MTTIPHEAQDILREYRPHGFGVLATLPPGLSEAAACVVLYLGALDEIEDHAELTGPAKAVLLERVSACLRHGANPGDVDAALNGYENTLPGITTRLSTWVELAPKGIAPRILDAAATTGTGMATWARREFRIRTISDLDHYISDVVNPLSLLMSDLWAWHDGTRVSHSDGVTLGYVLQMVDIIIDRDEDLARGVDFWPDGWGIIDMGNHVRTQIPRVEAYIRDAGSDIVRSFSGSLLDYYADGLSEVLESHSEHTRAALGDIPTMLKQCHT